MNSSNCPRTVKELPLGLRLLRRVPIPRKLGVCEVLFRRQLQSQGIGWYSTAAGPLWKLDLANATHRWIVYGDYEGPSFWRWVRANQGSLRTIVDSGANIGQTVIYFSSILREARVFAYEPGSEARAWLEEGVAANAMGNVTILPKGLGAKPGILKLQSEGSENLHGSWNKVNETAGEPVEIATVDSEMERLGLETIDLWKLDMEGYEAEALKGASKALSSGRIRAIYVEASDATTLEILRQHDYAIHGISDHGRFESWRPTNSYDSALCLPRGHAFIG